MGHVAIDGTKIKANASKHKAMSYDRMDETAQRLRREMEELPRSAAAADAVEDAQHGKGKRGDELPAELARRQSRLEKIRAAKADLEREAKEKAEKARVEAEAKIAKRRGKEARTGKRPVGMTRKCRIRSRPNRIRRRNATSPIRRAVSCPMAPTRAVRCRASMRRRRWTAKRR